MKNGVTWGSDSISGSTINWTDNIPNVNNGEYSFNVGKDRFTMTIEDSIRDFKYISIEKAKEASTNSKSLKDIPAGAFMSFIKRNIFGNDMLVPVCKINKFPQHSYNNIKDAMKEAVRIMDELVKLTENYAKPENSSLADDDRYEIYVDEKTKAEFWFNKCYGTYSGSYSKNFLFRPVVLAFLACLVDSEVEKVSSNFWEDVNEACSWPSEDCSGKTTEEMANAMNSDVGPEYFKEHGPTITEAKEYTGSAIEKLNQRNAESF